MGDLPQLPTGDLGGMAIGPSSLASVGDSMLLVGASFSSSQIWPTANLAVFYPFLIHQRAVAYQMSHQNGTVVSGNVDVGIYNERGKRLVSKGSTAQAGTSSLQVHDITDTELVPGVYFSALVCDNITATFLRAAFNAQPARACGVVTMASAFVLPETATFAGLTISTISFGPVVHLAAVV